MDPVTIGVGLLLLVLILSRGNGSSGGATINVGGSAATAPSGAGATGIGFSGGRRTGGTTNANQAAANPSPSASPIATPAFQAARKDPTTAPGFGFVATEQPITLAGGLAKAQGVATRQDLSSVQEGLAIGRLGFDVAAQSSTVGGAIGLAPGQSISTAYPGLGAALNPAADAGFLAVEATGQALKGAGQLVATGRVNVIDPGYQPGQAGGGFNPVAMRAGGALTDAGNIVGGAAGVGALAGSYGLTAFLSGFKNASSGQQKQILGQSTVAAGQTALSVIPVVGAGLSAALGALAKTGTGQKVTMEAGRAGYNVYEAQKTIVNTGDVSKALGNLIGGGSSSAQRQNTFFGAVDQTVARLKQGGTLDANAVRGFNQSIAYGYRYVGGFDLTKLTFAVGTNPFKK